MSDKCLNYHEKTRSFKLEKCARNKNGWVMVAYLDGKTAVAFTDFVCYQYPMSEKVIPTADTVSRIIGNLQRFVKFYQEYVLDHSFEVIDNKTGMKVQPEELV